MNYNIINQYYCANKNKELAGKLNLTHGLILSIINEFGIISNYEIYKQLILFDKQISTKQKRINFLVDSRIIMEIEINSDGYILEQLIKDDNGVVKDLGCIICGLNDIPLDRHHYPIRAKDGGVETIDLCPNCHRRFHVKADYIKVYTFVESERKIYNSKKINNGN